MTHSAVLVVSGNCVVPFVCIVYYHFAEDEFAFPEFAMDDLPPVELPGASLPIINFPHKNSAAGSAEMSLPIPNPGKTTNLAVARTVSQTAVSAGSSVLGSQITGACGFHVVAVCRRGLKTGMCRLTRQPLNPVCLIPSYKATRVGALGA